MVHLGPAGAWAGSKPWHHQHGAFCVGMQNARLNSVMKPSSQVSEEAQEARKEPCTGHCVMLWSQKWSGHFQKLSKAGMWNIYQGELWAISKTCPEQRRVGFNRQGQAEELPKLSCSTHLTKNQPGWWTQTCMIQCLSGFCFALVRFLSILLFLHLKIGNVYSLCVESI